MYLQFCFADSSFIATVLCFVIYVIMCMNTDLLQLYVVKMLLLIVCIFT